MSFYLPSSELATRIHQGKEIEQWLAYVQTTEFAFIKRLVIDRDKDSFDVTYLESLDEGDEQFHDVYEFSALDPEDAPYGTTHSFDSLEEALSFANEEYGASLDKYVAGGMIQEEYRRQVLENK